MLIRLAATDIIDGVGSQRQAILTVALLWRFGHHANNALQDVVHVGEVAAAVAVVVDLDGFATQQLVGKTEVGHIGPSGRAIHGEEPQTGAGDVVKLRVAMGKQLVALLGGCIERNGVVHPVLHRKRHLLVAAVHTR